MEDLIKQFDGLEVDATSQSCELVLDLVVVVSISFLLNQFENLILNCILFRCSICFLEDLKSSPLSNYVLDMILKSLFIENVVVEYDGVHLDYSSRPKSIPDVRKAANRVKVFP